MPNAVYPKIPLARVIELRTDAPDRTPGAHVQGDAVVVLMVTAICAVLVGFAFLVGVMASQALYGAWGVVVPMPTLLAVSVLLGVMVTAWCLPALERNA